MSECPRLTIELVPKAAWFKNVRSEVSKEQWDVLRKQCYRAAGYVCECCGGKGKQWPVECHEVWEYNDSKHHQRLVRLIALCPKCHEVKHIGLAGIRNRTDIALAHLASVNGWSKQRAASYLADACAKWKERSNHEWTLDISFIKGGER